MKAIFITGPYEYNNKDELAKVQKTIDKIIDTEKCFHIPQVAESISKELPGSNTDLKSFYARVNILASNADITGFLATGMKNSIAYRKEKILEKKSAYIGALNTYRNPKSPAVKNPKYVKDEFKQYEDEVKAFEKDLCDIKLAFDTICNFDKHYVSSRDKEFKQIYYLINQFEKEVNLKEVPFDYDNIDLDLTKNLDNKQVQEAIAKFNAHFDKLLTRIVTF